ncbi:MAG: hypothetical protein EBQ78_00565 [Betaproteobacteria bacterium]|nr:hypothetical protein [Betaproteobacteria bacterium]NBY16184.1 hypothetical protein [Betaproteobacteria bacterium]
MLELSAVTSGLRPAEFPGLDRPRINATELLAYRPFDPTLGFLAATEYPRPQSGLGIFDRFMFSRRPN